MQTYTTPIQLCLFEVKETVKKVKDMIIEAVKEKEELFDWNKHGELFNWYKESR